MSRAPLVGCVAVTHCDLRMGQSKRSHIEPVHIEEAGRLKATYKERVVDMSQAAFGEVFGIGSQGMVWQYLNARSPLGLEAAHRFAAGLSCQIADFSPRLAGVAGLSAPGATQSPEPAEEARLADDERTILAAYRASDKRVRRIMMAAAREVLLPSK